MKFLLMTFLVISSLLAVVKIPDTAQDECYDNYSKISCPKDGNAYSGQDAEFNINPPSYMDNGDGTITDNITHLMWSKAVDDEKLSLDEATQHAKKMHLGGYNDWRIPTIKELYSLMDFRGYTGSSRSMSYSKAPSNAIPYINTDYFDFKYGNKNERYIDAQWLSSTKYVSTTMGKMETLFGVNFADGRIKGYGYKRAGTNREMKKFYVRYVRGTKEYGKNKFVDNGNKTLTDKSTNLMWTKFDSKKAMNWREALKYANDLKVGGYDDWRLPSAKELQYIVDYSRSPDTTSSPAINPLFKLSPIVNEAGQSDYGYYWTSTTHQEGPRRYDQAAYISFGRAIGKMRDRVMDVHGAGAQRSDPKSGSKMFRGPQGDAVRSYNYVLCVRGGDISNSTQKSTPSEYPNKLRVLENNSNETYGRVHNMQISPNMQGRSMPQDMQGGMQQNISNMQRPPQGGFVSRLDRDGDNRVSRTEFDGPPDRFDFHDANHDGYLSEDEAPKFRRK